MNEFDQTYKAIGFIKFATDPHRRTQTDFFSHEDIVERNNWLPNG